MSDSPLWQAIDHRDVVLLDNALAAGEDVNSRDAAGLTPLMVAAGRGDVAVVKRLLEAGADLFAVGGRAGGSALHKACQGGHLEVVRLLVEAGAFIDAATATTGHTPIIEAIWFKWPEVVQYLADQGASLNVRTHYGFSLLNHIEYGLKANARGRDKLLRCKEMVDLRQGRDKKMVEGQKLMAAVCEGNLTRVKGLLDSGTPVDERAPILGGFNDGQTPLLVACRDGHTEIVAELLDRGADVNAVEPTFLAVPLHKAVYNGHAEITKLLAARADVDLNFQGATNGYTPLHDAIWHGYDDCATVLLDAGARTDIQGHDGLTPLDLAEEVFGRDHELTARIRSCSSRSSTETRANSANAL